MLDSRLNYVVAVARAGSFTGAAQAVGITQSAVTKSVADLERQLGTALFHRTTRGALLTEAGRDFVDRAAKLLDDAHDLLDSACAKGGRFSGIVRIGVCPASLEWSLVDPLGDLIKRHPSIRIELVGSSFERMVQQLRGGSVDVAIGHDAAFSEWPDFRRAAIPSSEATTFVRRGHPILGEEAPSMAEISKYTFVSPSDSRPYGAIIRGIYEQQGVDWRSRVHVIDYFPVVKRIVASSDAIGVVALTYTETLAFTRHFVALRNLNPFPVSTLCCAWRARWEPKPAVRALISAMRDRTQVNSPSRKAAARRLEAVEFELA